MWLSALDRRPLASQAFKPAGGRRLAVKRRGLW